MKSGATAVATVHIEASADVIYDLVSDVTRMGEWSPECIEAKWLNGAVGPSVGAEFRGKNRYGLARWSTKPRVVAAERGREFGFVVPDVFGHDTVRWTYQFEAADSGTEVREVCEILRDLPLFIRWGQRWGMGVKDRKADPEANTRKTLDALKAEAEGTTTEPS